MLGLGGSHLKIRRTIRSAAFMLASARFNVHRDEVLEWYRLFAIRAMKRRERRVPLAPIFCSIAMTML